MIKELEGKDAEKQVESVAAGDLAQLDADEAFLREHSLGEEYLQRLREDQGKNKRLVRKVDLILLPLLGVTYILQYIDKQALSYSAVFDFFADTGISGSQYSWLPSVFYFAYFGAEFPWVFLAQRTRMAKVVSGCVLAWGAVLMITAASHDFGGLVVCRFFLGLFEAPVTTCFMLIVSQWYE